MLHITAGQMSAASGYLTRNWGDYGYRFTGIESPTTKVSLFHVAFSDGSRFTIAADRWGNCREIHPASDPAPMVAEMHAKASAA